ncbi:hypothetical protein ACIGXI_35655 [Kitasatospora aureofaciens]|uniref:hypothetical protein n=1 Tax=Kitasatospora aureofaciens TaxID=1894 RepID=UPI0037C540F5
MADDTNDRMDQALHRALLAELDRLAGQPDRARRAVDEARRTLAEDSSGEDDALGWWRWFQAGTRIGLPVDRAYGDYPSSVAGSYPLLHAAVLLRLATGARQSGDDAKAQELATWAVQAATGTIRPTRWAADALRVYAEIVNDAEAYQKASFLYRQLGRLHRLAEPVPADAWLPGEGADQLAIGLSAPGNLPLDDPEALQRLLFHEPAAVVAQLRTASAAAMPDGRDPGRSRVLRLESDDSAVHSLPWELAVTEPGGLGKGTLEGYRTLPNAAGQGTLLHLQTSLRDAVDPELPVDGFLGPRTRWAIARLTGQEGAEASALDPAALAGMTQPRRRPPHARPTVVIVAPPPAVQYESRGSHRLSGVDLADIYAASGFGIRLAESVNFGDTLTDVPSLVHISAPLEATPRRPYFDLSAPYPESRLASKSRGFISRPRLWRSGSGRRPSAWWCSTRRCPDPPWTSPSSFCGATTSRPGCSPGSPPPPFSGSG